MRKKALLVAGVIILLVCASSVQAQSCLTTVMSKPSAPQLRYVETFLNAPVAGMEICDRLIVSEGAVGPFDGHDHEYAYYLGGDPSLVSSWAFQEPFDGDLAYVVGPSAKYYRFRSTGAIEWTALAFE